MSDKLKKEIIDWVKTIAISLVLAFLIVQVIKPTIVSGESMYPTLNNKDYLILNRLSYKFGDIKRGDIIVESDLYTRYAGELQVALKDMKNSGKSNVVARIVEEELFLLDYIEPWTKFSFKLKK